MGMCWPFQLRAALLGEMYGPSYYHRLFHKFCMYNLCLLIPYLLLHPHLFCVFARNSLPDVTFFLTAFLLTFVIWSCLLCCLFHFLQSLLGHENFQNYLPQRSSPDRFWCYSRWNNHHLPLHSFKKERYKVLYNIMFTHTWLMSLQKYYV